MIFHDRGGASIVNPLLADRAERIAFWRGFASSVKSRGVDEIIFISESWIHHDLDKSLKQIQAGKEIKSLRKKGEALFLFYLNDKGRVIQISALITRDITNAILEDTFESELKPEDLPIFLTPFLPNGD